MVETFLTHIGLPQEVWYVMSTICLYMNEKAHVVYNFNSRFRLFKNTSSHLQCKCGCISETVQNVIMGVVTADHSTEVIIAYQIATIWMTLNNLQGHLPTASVFKCDFSYLNFGTNHIEVFRIGVMTDTGECYGIHDNIPTRMCSVSRGLFKF